MVTIRDVAREAGVSVATVSRIINKKGEASPETIDRVNNVIKKLNYKPNSIAKSLSKRNSDLIALLVPTISNPFFPELVKEIEAAANEKGYNLYLCNSDDERAKVKYYLDSMVDHYVCGAIINSLHVNAEDLAMLEERGIKTITIDRANFEHPFSAVTVDHKQGAKLAVQHLIEDQGCANILFISGPKDEQSAKDRLSGFEQAVSESSHRIQTDTVYGDFGMESGYQAVKSKLEAGGRFDSIFSSNDAMAIGAIRACSEFGRNVPQDVKVVGYDNIGFSSYMLPSLSTIDQRKDEIGRIAVDELLRLIQNKDLEPQKYNLEPRLLIRNSSQ
ncbi:LacI family transcriptional regulator [Paenibacillus sp. CAA11]|uniref:LacI family DNA-binding transcriptional regulator n=1 Tax=Paenibacillus sp. CAA11 TaxID=1532905 RepID=UPI000D382FFE|nr:LacI family DNA-binding transcriptional regulator [Paenibacillus sp. CAA11]AWB46539.1 LacI family transcriptional regulator [Paenibacillus sp. CAA11]